MGHFFFFFLNFILLKNIGVTKRDDWVVKFCWKFCSLKNFPPPKKNVSFQCYSCWGLSLTSCSFCSGGHKSMADILSEIHNPLFQRKWWPLILYMVDIYQGKPYSDSLLHSLSSCQMIKVSFLQMLKCVFIFVWNKSLQKIKEFCKFVWFWLWFLTFCIQWPTLKYQHYSGYVPTWCIIVSFLCC